jgi:mannosyltransferase OCH1-like enzyme
MYIPKIIHQTWKSSLLPDRFEKMSATWKDLHPDWEYTIWTDKMNREFISENFPHFLSTYDGYQKEIQRVDAVRYFILYKLGGVFIDLDFECRKNISSLIDQGGCVFGKEPREHCELHDKELVISNAFMASAPKHPYFKAICDELASDQSFYEQLSNPNDRVLETTGPFMLTRVYNSCENKHGITLLDPEVLTPLTKDEIDLLTAKQNNNDGLQQKIDQAFAIHYYIGTWWKNEKVLF